MGTCQKPDLRSSLDHIDHFPTRRRMSFTWGIGKLSLLVWAFKGRKSLTSLSFSDRGLGTGKQLVAQGVAYERINPTSRSSVSSLRTNWAWAGDKRMGGRQAGGPKVVISKGATLAGSLRSSISRANASRWS